MAPSLPTGLANHELESLQPYSKCHFKMKPRGWVTFSCFPTAHHEQIDQGYADKQKNFTETGG